MRVAEFFAGIGLVRQALEPAGFAVVWANDVDPKKLAMYRRNFDDRDFQLRDIREIAGADVPDIELATASFPCTDLSLAGARKGLAGTQSSMFWEFTRILGEMGERRPEAVMIENVPSFATSRAGQDLYEAVQRLNQLGYACDLMVVDARYFVPQSRPRLFVIGSLAALPNPGDWTASPLRPPWIGKFAAAHPDLALQALPLSLPTAKPPELADVVERLSPDDARWWDAERQGRFESELSPIQHVRLTNMIDASVAIWATAYRRSRRGRPAWEIRGDAISGCLRTARGGSSKQALVEASGGSYRVRWMTAVEYARLQGADGYRFEHVSENQALFGFGDAVCVPAVAWLGRSYLAPLITGETLGASATRQQTLALA